MKNTLLPFHAVTGLQAIGWRKARQGELGDQPVWPVRGGSSDDADDAADDQGDDSDTADDADDADKDDEKDWKAEFEAQKRVNRTLERKTKRDLARIRELEQGQPNKDDKGDKGDEPDVDAIKAQAKAEAAAELLRGRVEDKIEAKARTFTDPEDAVAVLLRQHEIDEFIDDGKIDVEAITEALKDLGEKKPHLLAQGKRFQGSADGGARSTKAARPKDLGEALTRHYSGK